MDADVRVQARRALLDKWRASLDTRAGAPGLRVLKAVLPNWDVWLDGDGPPLTYRVTQVLTGHGCFSEYLHRIGKEATAHCHHCDADVDSAQYTLEHCPTWAVLRHSLIVEIGWDLPPPAILEALLVSERDRRAVTSNEQVMLRKEAAEQVSGTPTLRGPAGRGAAEAVDASGRGALGPPLPPLGFKLKRWQGQRF